MEKPVKKIDSGISQVDKFEDSPLVQKKLGRLSKNDKIVYTLIHFYIHMMFGLSLSSMAPAFVDFKHILSTRMESIGLLPTFMSIGTLTGTLVSMTYKHANRQITLSMLVLGMAISTLAMPLSTHLWHLYLCVFVYGLGIGAWNGANNVILIEMWADISPALLQFSQFIYGIGTILGPLLAKKYVIGEMLCPGIYPRDCLGSTNTSLSANSLCDDHCYNYDRRPQLIKPFFIGGLLQTVGPLMMIVMYYIRPYVYHHNLTLEVVVSEDELARYKRFVPRTTIILCISVFLAFGIMSENMYTDFSATFFQFQRTLHLSAERSAEIFSTMSMALSFGRGLSVVVAMYLKPQTMISYQLLIVFVGYVFQICGQDQLSLLWLSAIVICFGYSSIFICLFSFVGQYMQVTDKIGGLFIASYNVIYLFLPFYISRYIETMPDTFLYIEISCLSVAIIAFAVVLAAVRNVPTDLIRKIGPNSGK